MRNKTRLVIAFRYYKTMVAFYGEEDVRSGLALVKMFEEKRKFLLTKRLESDMIEADNVFNIWTFRDRQCSLNSDVSLNSNINWDCETELISA